MSHGRIGKGYEYRVICDECGFKKWSSEVAMRWDGFIVCRDTCWEPRNILDFYRTRNDAHLLPFTRPDGPANGTSWTPSLSGFTISGGFSATSQSTYINDPTKKTFAYSLAFGFSALLTVANSATISLPTGFTVATDNGGTVREAMSGRYLTNCTATGTNIVITTGFVLLPTDTLIITGNFITT